MGTMQSANSPSLPSQLTFIDELFKFLVFYREQVITVFKFYYGVIAMIILIGGFSSYQSDNNYLFFYELAKKLGEVGLCFYILTVIPGIARRFGIKHKLISLLMIFRRYNGIAMFMTIFAHFTIVRGTRWLHSLPNKLALFELMGLTALILTLFLFLTSNDYSVQHLKKWWNWIHKLTYVIIWFIALHVLLQGVSTWSLLIGTTLLVQLISFTWSFQKKKSQFPSIN